MRHTEILLVTLFFVACHVLSPWISDLHRRARATVSSFSGGLASAYVFLHLIPEISEGGEVLGPRIYFVLLVGLALYYGLEILIHRRRGIRHADATIHFGAAALYSSLLVFTLGQQLPASPALTVVFAVSMGLHLTSGDFGLQERYEEIFVRKGRYILAVAVLAGYALNLVREPHEEAVDVLTAMLAGFMIFDIFRKELPEFHEARFAPFLLGMGSFLATHVLLGSE